VFVLARALTYATLFVAFVLVWLPARQLARVGVIRPPAVGPVELVGLVVCAVGAAIAVWCVLAFAVVGKGTPAPFDPPRRLVVQGPYRYVRNPMYLGAALALLGAAVFFRSLALAGFVAGFLVVTHLFVVRYEEPALTRLFGEEYAGYRASVRRWIPWSGTARSAIH
jgi:protein-S-isoprenylcysteine O-methyltransferase Ste14